MLCQEELQREEYGEALLLLLRRLLLARERPAEAAEAYRRKAVARDTGCWRSTTGS